MLLSLGLFTTLFATSSISGTLASVSISASQYSYITGAARQVGWNLQKIKDSSRWKSKNSTDLPWRTTQSIPFDSFSEDARQWTTSFKSSSNPELIFREVTIFKNFALEDPILGIKVSKPSVEAKIASHFDSDGYSKIKSLIDVERNVSTSVWAKKLPDDNFSIVGVKISTKGYSLDYSVIQAPHLPTYNEENTVVSPQEYEKINTIYSDIAYPEQSVSKEAEIQKSATLKNIMRAIPKVSIQPTAQKPAQATDSAGLLSSKRIVAMPLPQYPASISPQMLTVPTVATSVANPITMGVPSAVAVPTRPTAAGTKNPTPAPKDVAVTVQNTVAASAPAVNLPKSASKSSSKAPITSTKIIKTSTPLLKLTPSQKKQQLLSQLSKTNEASDALVVLQSKIKKESAEIASSRANTERKIKELNKILSKIEEEKIKQALLSKNKNLRDLKTLLLSQIGDIKQEAENQIAESRANLLEKYNSLKIVNKELGVPTLASISAKKAKNKKKITPKKPSKPSATELKWMKIVSKLSTKVDELSSRLSETASKTKIPSTANKKVKSVAKTKKPKSAPKPKKVKSIPSPKKVKSVAKPQNAKSIPSPKKVSSAPDVKNAIRSASPSKNKNQAVAPDIRLEASPKPAKPYLNRASPALEVNRIIKGVSTKEKITNPYHPKKTTINPPKVKKVPAKLTQGKKPAAAVKPSPSLGLSLSTNHKSVKLTKESQESKSSVVGDVILIAILLLGLAYWGYRKYIPTSVATIDPNEPPPEGESPIPGLADPTDDPETKSPSSPQGDSTNSLIAEQSPPENTEAEAEAEVEAEVETKVETETEVETETPKPLEDQPLIGQLKEVKDTAEDTQSESIVSEDTGEVAEDIVVDTKATVEDTQETVEETKDTATPEIQGAEDTPESPSAELKPIEGKDAAEDVKVQKSSKSDDQQLSKTEDT